MRTFLLGLMSLMILVGCSGSQQEEWTEERTEYLEVIDSLEAKVLALEDEKKGLVAELDSLGIDGGETGETDDDENGLALAPYSRHYHFQDTFEEYIYAIYRGEEENKSILQLRQIDTSGSSRLFYQVSDKNLDFRINPLDGSIVIETGNNLILLDSQGNLIREFVKGDFEVSSEEGISLLDFQEDSDIIWLTSQETYIIKNYITLDVRTGEVNIYPFELGPSEDYDLDMTSGWLLTSDYPMFLDVNTRDAYLAGNQWTNLYLYNVFTGEKYFVDQGEVNLFNPRWSYNSLFEYQIDGRFVQSSIEEIITNNELQISDSLVETYGIQLYTQGNLYLEDGIIINMEKYNSMDFITWHKVWNHIPVGTLSTHSYPTIKDRVIYIVVNQTLYAIDFDTGETLWQAENVGASATDQPPLIDENGTIYLSGQFQPNLTAIQDGQILWQVSSDDLYGIQKLELKENQLIVHLDYETVFTYDKSGNRID